MVAYFVSLVLAQVEKENGWAERRVNNPRLKRMRMCWAYWIKKDSVPME
jgi:hypothetical protein